MDLVTGLMLVNKIKQLEIALSKTNSFDEIENMYKNFKEIVN